MTKASGTVNFICTECGKPDSYKASQARFYKGMGKYCSLPCKWAHYRSHPESAPGYRSGKAKHSAGYIVLTHGRQGRQFEHRAVMETHLGRQLGTDEHVHHKNGIKTDNRIENLEVLSASEHHKHHCAEGIGIASPKARESCKIKSIEKWRTWRATHWSKVAEKCVVCGTMAIKHQGQGKCRQCYLREFRATHTRKKLTDVEIMLADKP